MDKLWHIDKIEYYSEAKGTKFWYMQQYGCRDIAESHVDEKWSRLQKSTDYLIPLLWSFRVGNTNLWL